MTANDVLHLISRFVHIASVILFLGGVIYARQVLVPSLNYLPEDVRLKTAAAVQGRYRNTLYTLLTLIVLSGLYNFLSGVKHTPTYQMWIGIKFLLVAHILASGILYALSPYGDVVVAGKSKKRLLSIAISGILVVFISAYLRSLSQRGM